MVVDDVPNKTFVFYDKCISHFEELYHFVELLLYKKSKHECYKSSPLCCM